MNAYELADELNQIDEVEYDDLITIEVAIKVLRQQADRIAELEKKLQESAMNCISAYAQADDHYARVKKLEKDLHMTERHYERLCTQTKPLSDEEMVSEWDLISYDPKTYTWTDKCSNDLIIRFGRAIEAKVRGQ